MVNPGSTDSTGVFSYNDVLSASGGQSSFTCGGDVENLTATTVYEGLNTSVDIDGSSNTINKPGYVALATARTVKMFTGGVLFSICVLFATSQCDAQTLKPGAIIQDCTECPEMLVIPAGSFLMGSSTAEIERDFASIPAPPSGFSMSKMLGFTDQAQAKKAMATEQPQHRVTIRRDFALGKYPVTGGEFAIFVQETGHITGPCTIFGHMHETNWGAAWQHPGITPAEHDPVVCVSWNDAEACISWINRKLHGRA